MAFQFTAAAERALVAASRWQRTAGGEPLEPPELLLGLLAEEECRGARMLAACGIEANDVHRRWPELTIGEPDARRAHDFSPALGDILATAGERLADYPRPLVLATEHLLLGLVAAANPTARWLVEHGLTERGVMDEIERLYGRQHGEPVDLDLEAETVAWAPGPPSPSVPLEKGMGGPAAHPESALSSHVALVRLIDACENRAREGMRVLEDYARFALDDRHLTEQFKRLRHDLVAALANIGRLDRLASRETQADVGTTISTAGELRRDDVTGVLAANSKRVQESLRSLEEYGKLFDPAAAASIEQLRYRSYTLERAIEITRSSRTTLAGTRLYVLIDGRDSLGEFEALAGSLIAAGVHVLQLRDKTLSDRDLLQRARRLRALTRDNSTLFIMNDRPDLAVLVGADGVHVGQEEMRVKDVRAIVGPGPLIGVSTHSLAQAQEAVLDGANYIGVGPTFPSATKQFEAFPGLKLLADVAAEISLPAFAIGGITMENIGQVLASGFRRAAVAGAVTLAADPAAAARELLAALEMFQFNAEQAQ